MYFCLQAPLFLYWVAFHKSLNMYWNISRYTLSVVLLMFLLNTSVKSQEEKGSASSIRTPPAWFSSPSVRRTWRCVSNVCLASEKGVDKAKSILDTFYRGALRTPQEYGHIGPVERIVDSTGMYGPQGIVYYQLNPIQTVSVGLTDNDCCCKTTRTMQCPESDGSDFHIFQFPECNLFQCFEIGICDDVANASGACQTTLGGRCGVQDVKHTVMGSERGGELSHLPYSVFREVAFNGYCKCESCNQS